jgi:polyhydroxyalkanoate synthesis regulator phasin
MQDAWRAYLELAMGLTEAPRKRAQDVARRLVGSGGATAAQLQALGEELVSTGAANREALTKLVRFEVDRALGAVGLATADEVAELTRRVHDLERQLREARTVGSAGAPAQPAPAPGPAGRLPDAEVGVRPEAGLVPSSGSAAAPVSAHPAKKAVAKKAVAKKAIVKKPPATVTRTSTDDSATPTSPAKKAVRKRQPGGEA